MAQYLTVTDSDKEQSSDGVDLLVSMLIRYPQIGTISFEPDNNSVKFTFIISGVLLKEDYEMIKELIAASIDNYHALLQTEKTLAAVDLYSYDEVSMLTVVRDLPSLSCAEIALLVDILSEKFADSLATDINSAVLDYENILLHDAVIEKILKNIRKNNKTNKSLIGIREEGRVFVFNKQ